jgi:proline iminopeptidase
MRYASSVMTIENLGAKIWMRSAGHDGPPVIYVHGGPGYSSYNFEKAIGPLLEKSLRMIYFDQRDCGRSIEVEPEAPFDVDALVSDIEAVRRAAGADEVGLLAHSFGGLLALEYLRRHPARVRSLLLLESIPDLAAMIRYQTRRLIEISAKYPQLKEVEEEGSALERLLALQKRLNWFDLQRELFWRQSDALIKNAAIDVESRLFDRHQSRLLPSLAASGYLESAHEEFHRPLPVKCAMFAGRFSHCIGQENLERMSAILKAPLVWFEESGHLPYIEEPDAFARQTCAFFRPS